MYDNHRLLENYRKRGNSRNLKRFASGVVDAYLLVLPKLTKIKKGKELIKRFSGIDSQIANITEKNPEKWVEWFKVTLDAIEYIGVTKITLPSTRVGEELLEGTIMAGMD